MFRACVCWRLTQQVKEGYAEGDLENPMSVAPGGGLPRGAHIVLSAAKLGQGGSRDVIVWLEGDAVSGCAIAAWVLAMKAEAERGQ